MTMADWFDERPRTDEIDGDAAIKAREEEPQ